MQVADDDVFDAVGRDASSKPVSTTMVPDGPTIAQTKKSSGCSTSCGSPSM
jgi:hypothetical protein